MNVNGRIKMAKLVNSANTYFLIATMNNIDYFDAFIMCV